MNKNNDTAKKQEGMGKGLLIIAGLILLGAVGGYLAASFADGKDLDRIFKDLDGFTVGIVFTVCTSFSRLYCLSCHMRSSRE